MAKVNRRTALFTLGGGTALVLGAGGLWSVTRDPAKARTPWTAADLKTDDPRLWAFAHAILAPSQHNLQPWKIRLEGISAATLFCDLGRRAPAVDPFDRQTTISFGAFLGLAKIAAAEIGQRLDVTPFPEGPALPQLDERPIAQIRFAADSAVGKDPLFSTIQKRRTNRAPFDTDEQIRTHDLEALQALGTDAASIRTTALRYRISTLRSITVDAIIQEAGTDPALQEQIRSMRIGKAEIEANPDGIALAGAGLEAAQTFGMLNRDMLGNRKSAAFRQSLDLQTKAAATAMAYAWVLTPGNSREDQLAAGEAYARLDLEAAARGIAIQPLSQALEEYPEMAEPRAALANELAPPDGARVQMLARLGKAAAPPPAPRWPLKAKLISA
ncbi:MAG: hypothetical protein ABWZ40_01320 [Caulobacterales bacterium]